MTGFKKGPYSVDAVGITTPEQRREFAVQQLEEFARRIKTESLPIETLFVIAIVEDGSSKVSMMLDEDNVDEGINALLELSMTIHEEYPEVCAEAAFGAKLNG